MALQRHRRAGRLENRDQRWYLPPSSFSTLKQVDVGNVKDLKGMWMTRLKGSGFGGKYSFPVPP
jgi:hypothetical protein